MGKKMETTMVLGLGFTVCGDSIEGLGFRVEDLGDYYRFWGGVL